MESFSLKDFETENIDWSKAPKGTTHARIDLGIVWFEKHENGTLFSAGRDLTTKKWTGNWHDICTLAEIDLKGRYKK